MRWIRDNLGVDVPVHFTAFHPDFKMTDTADAPGDADARPADRAGRRTVRTSTPAMCTTSRAEPQHVRDAARAVVVRDWYSMRCYQLTDSGCCRACRTRLPGVYDGPVGQWGARRLPVRIA